MLSDDVELPPIGAAAAEADAPVIPRPAYPPPPAPRDLGDWYVVAGTRGAGVVETSWELIVPKSKRVRQARVTVPVAAWLLDQIARLPVDEQDEGKELEPRVQWVHNRRTREIAMLPVRYGGQKLLRQRGDLEGYPRVLYVLSVAAALRSNARYQLSIEEMPAGQVLLVRGTKL